MVDSKRKISDLQKGIIACPNCDEILHLNAYQSLKVVACPNCDTPIFIPFKLKSYWLYRPLGGGGMGSVYQAFSEDIAGEFAVKILPRKRKKDPELIKTLRMEGEIGTILGKSPHLIDVVDYGCEGDEHYMVSRFVEGTRLDVFISSATMLSERQALDIMTQLLDAEIHIKNCGYLYRDIKPENIIIVEETATVKLLDFGLCLPLNQAATPNTEGNLEGAVFYLPPERIVAAPEGEYSEIYSLGMLLFHMVAGETYFSSADAKDVMTKHIRSPRNPNVRSRLKRCSSELVNILDKMIQGNPNERYHTLAEIAEIIDEFSKNASGYSLAPPTDPHLEFILESKKSTSIKVLAVMLKLIIVLLLSAGLVGGWFYAQKLERERNYRTIVRKVATELNIPLDIKAPSLSRKDIEKLVLEKKSLKIKQLEASLASFNEKFEKIELCRLHSINIDQLKENYPTLGSIKQQMKQDRTAAIEKKLNAANMVFPEEKVKSNIADIIDIQLPVTPPSKSIQMIEKEAHTAAALQGNEQFPITLLAKLNMNIIKRYQCYKIGDTVLVPLPSGKKIEGIYEEMQGNKIIIDGNELLIADLPEAIKIKFDYNLTGQLIQQGKSRVKKLFFEKKSKYQASRYNSMIKKLYHQNGYIKSGEKWRPALSVFNELLNKKKEDFEQEKLVREENIIKTVKGNFDIDTYYSDAGYRKINETWSTEKDIIKMLIAEKRSEFEAKREKQFLEIKNEIHSIREVEIYIKNRYIFYDGAWHSARKILNKIVKKKMESIR